MDNGVKLSMRENGILVLLACLLCGCSSNATLEHVESDSAKMYEEYRKVLHDLHEQGELWGRGKVSLDDDFGNIEENQFAIYDIDHDGRDELILIYETNAVADSIEIVYDYSFEKGEIQEQYAEFPNLKFYDNGMIYAGISHNQGVAGRFWPYQLYAYEPETDSYVIVAFVDAWDGNFAPTNYENEDFPEAVDADGNGLIYYVEEKRVGENEDETDYLEPAPIDDSAYEQWWDTYMDGAKELELPFVNLTTENIECIGVEGN